MNGKLKKIIFVSLGLMAASAVWAQSNSGLQFGACFDYNMGAGAVTEHEKGNIGGGVDVFYQLPVDLPEFLGLGFCGSVTFDTAVGKADYVDSWNVSNILAGVWFEVNVASMLKIRPEVSYGAALNFVESKTRNVTGLHADQLVSLGCTLVLEPEVLKGFALYGGADYKFMPEKQNLGNFIGFKAGVLYRPGKTGGKAAE